MAMQGINVAGNSPAAAPSLSPTGPVSPSSRVWPPNLQEITTTVIALVIVSITTWMIYSTFSNLGDMHSHAGAPGIDQEAYGRSKDILSLALGLFGTVTGYYFGRVPAEKQADAARHSADVAQQGQAAAESKTQQLRRDLKSRIQGIINNTPPTQAALAGASQPVQQSQASITEQLTSLLADL